MPRRVSMPGADELFRATTPSTEAPPSPPAEAPQPEADSASRSSGRVKHDEKMTVYLTADELMAVEQARLALRSQLGSKVDRGRLVRAALTLALADLEKNGESSDLAQRLRDQ